MHILQAQTRRIEDGEEAVDLAQSPGDIVILTAADTEISGFAYAAGSLEDAFPSLRIASLLALSHPYSVDLYADNTLSQAKLIVVRVLGGRNYWTYGFERLAELANARSIGIIVVPGDANWDSDLEAANTLDIATARMFWRYCVEGGVENLKNALRYLAQQIGYESPAAPPKPLPRAGLYWPGEAEPALDAVRNSFIRKGTAAIIFYRSSVQANATAPVDVLIKALDRVGLNALPIYVSSLKDPESVAVLTSILDQAGPSITLNGTAFAVSKAGGSHVATPLDQAGRMVLQFVMSGTSEAGWRESDRGLSAKDLTMHVVLPEIDGRVLTQVISFKEEGAFDTRTECRPTQFVPIADRITRLATQAAAWSGLRDAAASDKKLALILSNYPNKDGRIANGVGLDTPASTIALMKTLQAEGYPVEDAPEDGKSLMDLLMQGPTNAFDEKRLRRAKHGLPLERYLHYYRELPESLQKAVEERWGAPQDDPACVDGIFRLAVHTFGNIAVAIQPARGYNIDPKETYHDPALVPPHNYLAFYAWLRGEFGAVALVHMGKHGNTEWLPGKALTLSSECWPDAIMQGLPVVYPFIVNDPGEGAQAKRRMSSVIVDHLMPSMTRAESYGPLSEIEALIDEYFLATGVDSKRVRLLETQIFEAIERHSLGAELGLPPDAEKQEVLQRLDGYICELKEMQIRDGLHSLGQSPQGAQRTDTLVALARVPGASHMSLHRALAADLGLQQFDPLACELAAPWSGPQPGALAKVSDQPWRTNADTLERIECLAAQLVSDNLSVPNGWDRTTEVLALVNGAMAKALDDSGRSEIEACMTALGGSFVPPGPSGAPTRGRLDCLPTGRNFYSVDVRSVPTRAAWQLGRQSADLVTERYFQEQGEWPPALALTAWGTSNMRTGGDDIAQAMALIGAEPVWEELSGRVTGFRIIPLSELKRPRVDVTLRISGFFRDAFPLQIDLFDSAVRGIAALEEPEQANPIAARVQAETRDLVSAGLSEEDAAKRAGFRVFGSMPGAYGAGLQALIDENLWQDRSDFSESFLNWGGFAYGAGAEGEGARDMLETRLGQTRLVLQNQDNREHDILDSDDYYQFQGGLTAAVATLSGVEPAVYHGDHSRPETPAVRSLQEELSRVVRGRAANPKWIAGMMRHGYKGAFEMAATLDYLFAYAATTKAVQSHQFDLLYDAYFDNHDVRRFIELHNPAALKEMADRFLQAIDRELWQPRRNSIFAELKYLKGEKVA